ncbi:hypothetical protein [Poseidonocella sp. HB161398]|uniref:hypothetical protein n=1 Tax=Poseidonocella sp. HB161398 TaxID=2320855 RepID=UPI0011080102|nr:hypothetical protein [Poseidonocella sp. HB161398]
MTETLPFPPPVILVMERDPFIQSDIGMILHEVMPDAAIHMCGDTESAGRLATGLGRVTLCVLKLMRHDPLDPAVADKAAARGARVLLLGDLADLGGPAPGTEQIRVLPVPFSGATFRAALADLGFRSFP